LAEPSSEFVFRSVSKPASIGTGLIHLLTDLIYFAIGFDLGFIAPDNFRNLLRVTRGTPSLSLRVRWHGSDQQSGNKYFHAY
jgi:hypothetical protein